MTHDVETKNDLGGKSEKTSHEKQTQLYSTGNISD
jgi:hypothetical protein